MKDESEPKKSATGKELPRIERTLQAALVQRDTESQLDRALWCLENIEVYKALEQAIADLKDIYLQRHGYFGPDDPEINSKLLELIDIAIEEGHWEGGLFFENAGKQLKDFRGRLASEMVCSTDDAKQKQAQDPFQREGHTAVFVALYHTGGESILSWEKHLETLKSHSVGRPIYRHEADVRRFIQARPNKKLEAYISVFVRNEHIIKPKTQSQQMRDRSGCELLQVKDSSILPENIIQFVNYSGTYQYDKGRLHLVVKV